MTSNHFFVPKAQCLGDRAVLRGAEEHHFRRVLRGSRGDEVWIFDEDGVRSRARVERLTGGEVVLAVLERSAPEEVGTRIVLAQAVLKSKAMAWVIQKAAEFGAAAVIPVTSSRTVARVEPGSDRKSGRWARIALEASKQARTARPPVIEPALKLADFLASSEAPAKLVLSEHGNTRLGEILDVLVSRSGGRPPAAVAVLLGPEGGWSEDEEASFPRHGFIPASLGRTTLRAETAAVAALAIVAHAWKW